MTNIVIGLGATGLSCIRFLRRQGLPVIVMDTRENPPNLASFSQDFPEVALYLGVHTWSQKILNEAQSIIVSPGVSTLLPPIQEAKAKGVEIIGDIELFARINSTPVIAITGSNGKSTVTALVGEMARCAGKKVAVVGNIGTPVLDILSDTHDLIVMELSSFQLETTHSLHPLVSTVLNITPDHLDRYTDMAAYVQAKHRIHLHAKQVVINKQDPLSDSAEIASTAKRWGFTLEEPEMGTFGLQTQNGQTWISHETKECLLPIDQLQIVGRHNVANALSALSLGYLAEISMPAMLKALRTFPGLPHRCQWVASHNEITWINDSKGTNIVACQAALKGLGEGFHGKIVLLLGGQGKGADFTELSAEVMRYCRALILMGEDAPILQKALANTVPLCMVANMQEAVASAAKAALPGDIILLSPACASLDQYRDFTHRGEVFTTTVKQWLALD